MAKLKHPLYARLKEMGEFFPVVLWPLLKERKTFWLLAIALCFILLSSVLYLTLQGIAPFTLQGPCIFKSLPVLPSASRESSASTIVTR